MTPSQARNPDEVRRRIASRKANLSSGIFHLVAFSDLDLARVPPPRSEVGTKVTLRRHTRRPEALQYSQSRKWCFRRHRVGVQIKLVIPYNIRKEASNAWRSRLCTLQPRAPKPKSVTLMLPTLRCGLQTAQGVNSDLPLLG